MTVAPHPIVAHNFYSSDVPSGENAAVEADVRLLRNAGITVETLFTHSDSIGDGARGRFAVLAKLFGSRTADQYVATAVKQRGVNLLHVHNLYPLISPSVIRAAKRCGIPVVATVHNYRLVCAKGTYFRNGHICTSCNARTWAWPAVAYGCYRGSRAQSLALTSAMSFHRTTWSLVDRWLGVSSFVAGFLERAGIPAHRIRVRSGLPYATGQPAKHRGAGILFAGRLDPSKGIGLLLEAWERLEEDPSRPLIIAGSGPSKDAVVAAAARRSDIEYLGVIPPAAVGQVIDRAAATCIPSVWYEGLPTALLETMAHGRPVVATAIGSLRDVVTDEVGWAVEPNADALAKALSEARRGSASRGAQARQLYERNYTEETGLQQLCSVYAEVLG